MNILRRLGLEYRQTKLLPRVADETAQAKLIAFYEELMNTLPADEAVCFADPAQPEYQANPACGWLRIRSNPAMKTIAGRGRVNIHGAVCLESFDAPFVEPVTVDGISATQLLAKIEANDPDKSKIHIIWHNARYHRCKTV